MFSSPLVLAKRKDGGQRMCVDFRRLNAVTKPTYYSFISVEDEIDFVANFQPKF